MAMPTIFKSEVGDILVALSAAGAGRSQDWYDALYAVAVALGLQQRMGERIRGHEPACRVLSGDHAGIPGRNQDQEGSGIGGDPW